MNDWQWIPVGLLLAASVWTYWKGYRLRREAGLRFWDKHPNNSQ